MSRARSCLLTLAASVVVGVGLVFMPTVARADLGACIAASEGALTSRRAGKLGEARRQLAACAIPTCPEELRLECTKRMEALNGAMPSVVALAKDRAGNDLLTGEVMLDGVVVAHALDGRPIELDPGNHILAVTVPGLPAALRTIVVGEGSKARHETFILGAAPVPVPLVPLVPTLARLPDGAPPAEKEAWGPRRTWAVAAGAVGVVGLGLGTAFGLTASSKWSNAENETTAQKACASAASCAAHASAVSDHDSAETFAALSTVAIGVGAALIVTGVVTWLMAPRRSPGPATDTTASFQVWPSLLPGGGSRGGSLVVVGGF